MRRSNSNGWLQSHGLRHAHRRTRESFARVHRPCFQGLRTQRAEPPSLAPGHPNGSRTTFWRTAATPPASCPSHDRADRHCTRNPSIRDGTTAPKRPPWIIWRGRLQGRCETHRHLPATNGRTHKFQLLPPNIPGCVRDPRRRTRQLIPAACPWIQPKSPYPKAPKAPLLNQGGFSLFSNAT